MAKAGRRNRVRRGRSDIVNQRPWRQVENLFPPVEVLSQDGLEKIENAALTILEEIGMDFLHPETHAILRKAGADVEPGSDRVRFDRHLVLENVAKAPATYTLHARNPEHNLNMGGRWLTFGAVSSPVTKKISRTSFALVKHLTVFISSAAIRSSRWICHHRPVILIASTALSAFPTSSIMPIPLGANGFWMASRWRELLAVSVSSSFAGNPA